MATPKVDWLEIDAAKQARNFDDLPEESLQAEIKAKVAEVAGGGFITAAGASELLRWAQCQQNLPHYFPNNTLLRSLQNILLPGNWDAANEEALLRFLTACYLEEGLDEATWGLNDYFRSPHPLLGDLWEDIFDSPEMPLDLAGRFVEHTGKFAFGTRKDCWAKLRELGGIPVEQVWFLDYLFVSDELFMSRGFSNKIMHALVTRARLGMLRIFRESVWDLLVK